MNKFKNLKLNQQVLILFSIAIILMITVQLYYYLHISWMMQNKVQTYSENIVKQIEENVNSIINNISETGYKVGYNHYIQEYLQADSIIERLEIKDSLYEICNIAIDTNDDIYDIGLVDMGGKWISIYDNMDYFTYSSIKEKINFMDREINESKYITIKEKNQIYYAFIVPIFSIKPDSPLKNKIGTAIILSRVTNIKNILDQITDDNETHFMIIDKGNSIIASNIDYQAGQLYTDSLNFGEEKSNIIMKEQLIEKTGWRIYSFISREVIRDLYHLEIVIIITSIVFILLFLGLYFVFSHNITDPIERVVENIKDIGEEHIKRRIDLPVEGEIGVIVKQINHMLDKIERITRKDLANHKKYYEMKLSKKQAELSALQSQINPHFLYNTLDCMRSIAMVNDIDEIAEISTAMAEIFRYNIKGSNYVKVEEELDIIKEYLRIMKLRFRNKFTVLFDIDNELLDYKIIKMSLQPIVENAVFHGLESKSGSGLLLIEGMVSKNIIIFKIRDNGKGIEKEELKKIRYNLNTILENQLLNTGRSIGLININKRIKLFLGKGFGLEINSKIHEGTEVIIRLPLNE